eukprot:1139640-Pelagomonas_calceolata.AAC.3
MSSACMGLGQGQVLQATQTGTHSSCYFRAATFHAFLHTTPLTWAAGSDAKWSCRAVRCFAVRSDAKLRSWDARSSPPAVEASTNCRDLLNAWAHIGSGTHC